MKYAVFLGDGMADLPLRELGGKTPLDAAVHPAMDALAREGLFGTTRTVPEGMAPGSDTANLSVFGYDPARYYSGRSPLEAVSMGIRLEPEDAAYRCNTVTLSEADALEDAVMLDYSAGEIESEDSAEIIKSIAEQFKDRAELYPGIKYRHCLVLRNANTGAETTPPHDISGKPVRGRLPRGENAALLREIMEYSYAVLPRHPVNIRRVREGKRPVSALWFWGEGRRPQLPTYREKYGIGGSVISAVDLIRGIGQCAGLNSVIVSGATGDWHTDFAAKGRAAIEALQKDDFVYIHVEAPDECGHHAEIREKVWSIEQIDEKIVMPVMEHLRSCGEDFCVLLMPDHPTPISIMTHSADPVPFALFDSRKPRKNADKSVRLTEACAAGAGVHVERAWELMSMMTGVK
ncbi:MAG: cofactor-independent phosphoglycerate mutase [Clostridia bacterium]|nr:cofactor-independent phosphoglycerate mutase [Clostridia bacterium]